MRIFIKYPQKGQWDVERGHEFVTDEHGLSELHSVYNFETLTEQLEKNNEDYTIIYYDENMSNLNLDPKLIAKIKLLVTLQATNCGCCNSPFLSNKTFEEILEITKKLEKI